ncbi:MULTISPECIES: type II secretion system protein GspM [Novosphingobium]|uniref:type II secretion system protein GspM n=1 Tax=Novosphingobium TaxID=165696 RepID=UPI001CD5EB33|nr:type II secretion system protein GspM [Novosphingobium percolationis]
MNRVIQWRTGLTLRERRMVDFAAALTASIVLVYGLILPLGAAYDAATARHDAAVRRSAALVANIKALEAAPLAKASGPIDQQVAATAQEAGLVVQSLQPRGSARVAVAIASVPASSALRWLDRLGGMGLAVEGLTLRPAPDGTVMLDLVVRRP